MNCPACKRIAVSLWNFIIHYFQYRSISFLCSHCHVRLRISGWSRNGWILLGVELLGLVVMLVLQTELTKWIGLLSYLFSLGALVLISIFLWFSCRWKDAYVILHQEHESAINLESDTQSEILQQDFNEPIGPLKEQKAPSREEERLWAFISIYLIILGGLPMLLASLNAVIGSPTLDSPFRTHLILASSLLLAGILILLMKRSVLINAPLHEEQLQARWKEKIASVPARKIVDEFQKRRQKTLTHAVLPGMGGFIIALLMILISRGALDEVGVGIVLLGFLVFATGIINTNRIYKCPICENVIVHSYGGHRSFPLDPEQCERCGAILKYRKRL
ncbi:MAG: hypothetical protein V1799_15860 [bacterium]